MEASYQLNLGSLLGLCGALFIAQRYSSKEQPEEKLPKSKKQIKDKVVDSTEASQWPFLTVFALVMGSDWLQARPSHPPALQLTHPSNRPPGTIFILALPRRAWNLLRSRINALHHRLRLRRPIRLRHGHIGRCPRPQAGMPRFLRSICALLHSHHDSLASAALPWPHFGRHQHKSPFQRL